MEPEHIDTGDADKMADAVPADAKDDAEETSEDLVDADEEEVAEPKKGKTERSCEAFWQKISHKNRLKARINL